MVKMAFILPPKKEATHTHVVALMHGHSFFYPHGKGKQTEPGKWVMPACCPELQMTS